MRQTSLCAAVVLLSLSCSNRDKTSDDPAEPADPANPPATSNPSEPPAPPPRDPPVKEHMQDHFSAIRDIERALVAGDLPKAKERARYLAEHEPHEALESWEPHLVSVREAANDIGAAKDIAGAAVLAGVLGNECAACHLTMTAITSFPYEELPPAGGSNKAMMQRHQWAADRLWEGLIGPSESSWSQGAEILAKAPFVPQVTLSADDKKRVEELANNVHQLATRAAKVELDERATLYSELLTTCSSCHSIARKPKP